MQTYQFPPDFLFGAATSSLQIEGCDANNNWYHWSQQPGKIADNQHCHTCCDHYNRLTEDITLLKELQVQSYRFSLEWSRIEPTKGVFNAQAIEHYRQEIIMLRQAGIEPMVTLHHFSNPVWLEKLGGWLNRDVIFWFYRYADYVSRQLGDLVSLWITINEPNIYLLFSHVFGKWPPGDNNPLNFINGARNMIGAHIAAYNIIHSNSRLHKPNRCQVGVAHHLRVFQHHGIFFLDKMVSWIYDTYFQEIFVHGMASGELSFPFGSGYPFGQGDFQDFLGVNYYSRDIVSFDLLNPHTFFGHIHLNREGRLSDIGWEIYPPGLYQICSRYYQRYQKPIYITENGISDHEDLLRPKFIFDHLVQIYQLIADGIPIKGYYHWSLMDNFEWAQGFSPKFGLFEVNFNNQQRSIRQSGLFYAQICEQRAITPSAIAQYL